MGRFENILSLNEMIAREDSNIENGDDPRSDFYHDQTSIIFSKSFQKLKHKTQVFFFPGNDFLCTRMEHTLFVSSIAASICQGINKELGKDNLNIELVQAIALGHDLGHAPFGHEGGDFINNKLKSLRQKSKFYHEVQSLKTVTKLEKDGKGLNLCYATRDGILSHSGESSEEYIDISKKQKELEKYIIKPKKPSTWEAAIMKKSDKIAYIGRDIEDAKSLGLLTDNDISDVTKVIGKTNSKIVNNLVRDVIKSSLENGSICFSDDEYNAIRELSLISKEKIYNSKLRNNWKNYIELLINTLFDYHLDLYEKKSPFDLDSITFQGKDYGLKVHITNDEIQIDTKYKGNDSNLIKNFADFIFKLKNIYDDNTPKEEIVCDYIAGMTDNYAIECYNEILTGLTKRF